MKIANASKSSIAQRIIILIIILVHANVKLSTTHHAETTTSTGVSPIAHANASLKCLLIPQMPTLFMNGTVTAAVSTLLRTKMILAQTWTMLSLEQPTSLVWLTEVVPSRELFAHTANTMMATSDIASAITRLVVQTSTSTTLQTSATAVAFHKFAQTITFSTTNNANVTVSNLTQSVLLTNQQITQLEIQELLSSLSGALKIANAYVVQMATAQMAPTGTPANAHAHAHQSNVMIMTKHGTLLPVSADAAHQAFVDQTNTTTPSAAAANKSPKTALQAISGMLTLSLEKETVFNPQQFAMMVSTGALPSVAVSQLRLNAQLVNSGMVT